ncbi:endonuclease/exonuclease/phosphatase family protein [Streptomyces sp. CA-278952]|uniref:endonuclease/exonuclease/phosphatase family protein n=1 Tax=Streptomyces sp. CA-278952 TaxID=2980556 RepID=UPI0023681444|nr:endonuclease/exonuclease/phosphatase family protein [Streptomyces sp. CA-278952]WDG28765.1 endonuclease/exonuclease/phosphatase family protein [Streptomyces sp. CA-278952]
MRTAGVLAADGGANAAWPGGGWVVWAAGAWAVFLAAHLVLNGRWWFWLLPSLLPPPVFVALPGLLLPLSWATEDLTAAVVAGAALALGARQSGLVPGALVRGKRRPPPPPDGAVRVVSWNTQHWCQSTDPEPFYAFLRGLDADVYLLQEYHHDEFDGTYRLIDDERRLRETFPGHRAVIARGLITLSRLPVAATVETAARRTLRVDLEMPGDGRILATFNVHIPVQLRLISPLRTDFYRAVRSRAADRAREYRGLVGDVAGCPHPALIAGDFNTTAAIGDARRIARLGSDAVALSGRLCPTSWQARPGLRWWRLDWVLTTPGARVHRYRFRDPRGLSDHSVQEVSVSLAEPGHRTLADHRSRHHDEGTHHALPLPGKDRPAGQ